MNLILFGAYNLSSRKCFLNNLDGQRSNFATIQRLANARFAGSTVVGKKIDEKAIALEGVLAGDPLQTVVDEFDKYTNQEDRYLRISRDWLNLVATDSEDDFALSNDATNKSLSETNYMYRTGALFFDLDVSLSANDYGEITIVNNTTIDISAYKTGAIEAWVYIPDVTYISGITLTVGSDQANYLTSALITSQYDGAAFMNGWNYVSVDISDMIITGIIDFYRFGQYFKLRVSYQSAQGDLTGLAFGGAVWQNDDQTRNYKGYFEGIQKSNLSYDITHLTFSGAFICYGGIGVSTDDIDILSRTAITTLPYSFTLNFGGTYEPEPVITLTLNTVTNVAKIGLVNTTTGDTVELSETWVAKDVIVFDFVNKQVTRNNATINYSNVLPRFKTGLNSLNLYATSTSESINSQATNNSNLGGTV